jgi:Tol biopolymer transport system component
MLRRILPVLIAFLLANLCIAPMQAVVSPALDRSVYLPLLSKPSKPPSGRGHIAFTAQTTTGEQIVVMDADGSGRQQLTTQGGVSPTWSPDGTRIAFGSTYGVYKGIFTMRADGSSMTRLTTSLFELQNDPGWSPDSSQILFDVPRPDGSDLYIMNVDGSGVRLLRPNAYHGRWSPDGTRIAFGGLTSTGCSGLLLMKADGSAETNLTPTMCHYNYDPDWSPDGNRIVFVGACGLCIVKADGSEITTVPMPALGALSHPVWSPNGTQIAFTAGDWYGDKIYIINVDGSGLTLLTEYGRDPSWTAH